ncbi:potassium voltage-gated channel subfamily B member 1-like [Mya arenaria]|uniref:potassium voltage-gated channel subfamily B member 1-like n=1 Tax=Mya arenaria TaxID=6604 RepID=UPI0022DFE231|nr:potassium voltage-gated channel subfamily B member 1-like [Mya arenaria]XP_052820311.1 potassium voltage-gated channel subfamily B member 1-like [Mya arenaria]
MPTCCAYRYHGHFEELETHEKFKMHSGKRETSQVEPLLSEKKSRWTTLRGRVWSIIDYKVPSIAAKLYMALIFLMVLLCVFTQALSTMPEFQRALTKFIHIDMQHRHTYGLVKFLNYFQIFRTLRMIRLVSNLRASRVLVFSIRQNIKDMMLLGLLLTVAVSVTGHLIYFMEDPETIGSVPNAWYWAVITLTTVGYGDISPVTCLGKILASLMAISGVLLLAVTVPTFVNNFLTLYQYACLDDYIGSKLSAEQGPEQINSQVVRKTLTKDKSTINDNQ